MRSTDRGQIHADSCDVTEGGRKLYAHEQDADYVLEGESLVEFVPQERWDYITLEELHPARPEQSDDSGAWWAL